MQLSQKHDSALLDSYAISEHLEKLNYPKKSLENFKRCGQSSNVFILASCGCGTRPIELKFVCNNKFCPHCSKRRRKRFRNRLFPLLNYYRNNSLYQWRFLTISPKNYSSYEEGKKDIRVSWKKFLKRSYIKERIKGGFMAVEVTNKGKGWNFHLHAIIYSRRLDNVCRGDCPHCHQSYLKYDRIGKKFYCANRKCNKIYEGVLNESKLMREFSASANRSCVVDISNAGHPGRILNYISKYLSIEKDSFENVETYAFHIANSYKDRQINAFGEFYNFNKKIDQHPFLQNVCRCSICREKIFFSFDLEISELIRESRESLGPPPDLTSYIT